MLNSGQGGAFNVLLATVSCSKSQRSECEVVLFSVPRVD